MLLAVAPNGARKTAQDHPKLPITPAELAQTAKSCLAAGAGMMHLHVRDDNHQHCLDAQRYTDAFAAIRAQVGNTLFLQATTEAVGIYSPDEQMAMVRELADLQAQQATFGVSLAVRELMHENISDTTIADFFAFLRDRQILPQCIMYDVSDCRRFQGLLRRGVLPGSAYPCLFVVGRYHNNQQSNPAELLPFFSDLYGVKNWMACAFGAREASVAKAAALLGGHMRIGYENNLLLANGQMSADNAALIEQTAIALPELHRHAAKTKAITALLTPDW